MIVNDNQLNAAIEQAKTLEEMLEATRTHLAETAPALFPVVSEGYLKRISDLHDQIYAYLSERSASSPLGVRIVRRKADRRRINRSEMGRLGGDILAEVENSSEANVGFDYPLAEEGERTISGLLISIDIEKNRCEIIPDGGSEPKVACYYEDALEEGLIRAIKKRIEMTGHFTSGQKPIDPFRFIKIERFRVVGESQNDYTLTKSNGETKRG